MMNVDNCPKCGRIYIKNAQNLCQNCLRELDKQYEKCLQYLRDYRNCSINELSEATEVPVNQIIKFIREGRISIKNNPNMSISCELCSSPIREGTLCEACRQRLAKDAAHMREDEKKRQEPTAEPGKRAFNIIDRLQDRKNN